LSRPSSSTSLLAVVVEAQLTADGDKQWSWPVYLASLRARMRRPALLLVVRIDANLARRCARPIELGHPGYVVAPIVLGPDQVPAVHDPDLAARAPELIVNCADVAQLDRWIRRAANATALSDLFN
jgi:hypothetical protein